MPTSQENAIAQKLVTLTRNLQPQVSIVGNYLQFKHQGVIVKVPLASTSVVSDRAVRSR